MTQVATLIFFGSLVVMFFAAMSKSMAFLDTDDTSLQNMAMAVSSVGIAWSIAVMVIYGYIL